jgi:hypothetical protein
MKLTRNERIEAAIAHLVDVQERALARNYSRQPRFSGQPGDFFASVLHWVRRAEDDEPPYEADTRRRDRWLRDFWRKEPHLAGVLNSVMSIDQNRAWTLTGGRNQVNRFTRILRESEDGAGWRRYISLQALSYYTADIGAITETGRDGRNGPLRALYHVDPAKCMLTGDRRRPLKYDNNTQAWRPEDFFRVVSMASTDEEMRGVGYCAVSRCLELAKLMVAIYEHSFEKLGSRAPKGLLLLKGVSKDQWDAAMTQRSALLEGMEREYYGAVAVLASMGVDDVDAKLVALSQLPDGFDLKVWTDLLMFAYALCFGYDPIEFWPVQAGQLGRGRETEIQHRKATGKGGANFMLSYQDQLQMQLPESLIFEFEQRDSEGLLKDAEVAKAWAEVVNALYAGGMGVLTREQAASLLAEQGIIPVEWTTLEEDVAVTDTDSAQGTDEEEDIPAGPPPSTPQTGDDEQRARLLEREGIRRAIQRFPDEPVITYYWPTGRVRTWWRRGADALARVRGYSLPPRAVRRQDDEDVLYTGEDFTITEADVDAAIAQARARVGDEFAELLEAEEVDE